MFFLCILSLCLKFLNGSGFHKRSVCATYTCPGIFLEPGTFQREGGGMSRLAACTDTAKVLQKSMMARPLELLFLQGQKSSFLGHRNRVLSPPRGAEKF